MAKPIDDSHLRQEIVTLEQRLEDAKRQLRALDGCDNISQDGHSKSPSIHSLILLSDSALPLGSFAYSSGLESYLSHHKHSSHKLPKTAFSTFFHLSILSVAFTNVPYLLAAYRAPTNLTTLDNDLDASTPCLVARRASIAQGRALLSVWERSFEPHYARSTYAVPNASKALKEFKSQISTTSPSVPVGLNGHFAPLWGAVSSAMGLSAEHSAYTFLTNHAKAILSAAVRASVIGPYQAQQILASEELQLLLSDVLHEARSIQPEDAGQTVPLLDLWIGRHEKLYSRIFNS